MAVGIAQLVDTPRIKAVCAPSSSAQPSPLQAVYIRWPICPGDLTGRPSSKVAPGEFSQPNESGPHCDAGRILPRSRKRQSGLFIAIWAPCTSLPELQGWSRPFVRWFGAATAALVMAILIPLDLAGSEAVALTCVVTVLAAVSVISALLAIYHGLHGSRDPRLSSPADEPTHYDNRPALVAEGLVTVGPELNRILGVGDPTQ